MRFDEVIGTPLDRLQGVAQLAGVGDLLPVFHDAPRQHRHGEGHRQTKLYVVTRIVVSSYQIYLHKIYLMPTLVL